MASGPQERLKTDVVIIGFGPVGAMLANLLGLQGISTLVLEREAAILNLPRAVHFDDEVMRLLQKSGCEVSVAMTRAGYAAVYSCLAWYEVRG